MKLKIYAVKDVLVGFAQPFVMQNDQQATRSFSLTVNSKDNNNPIASSYRDFQLWQVAEWDDVTGELTPALRHIVDGASVKTPVESFSPSRTYDQFGRSVSERTFEEELHQSLPQQRRTDVSSGTQEEVPHSSDSSKVEDPGMDSPGSVSGDTPRSSPFQRFRRS